MLNHFKKYPKDYAKVFVAFTLAFFAVMGTELADRANTPFWWKFWAVLGVVSLVLCVGAWVYAWITQPTDKH